MKNIENEKKLIAHILHGDKSRFQELAQQYQQLVAHIVYSHVRDEKDREDICQDFFLKSMLIWLHSSSIRNCPSGSAKLTTTLV